MDERERIILLEDGSYLIRGHVSDAEAISLIRDQDDPEFTMDNFSFIERCHMRAIPCPPGYGADYNYRYEHSEPGRGAFACTAVWA